MSQTMIQLNQELQVLVTQSTESTIFRFCLDGMQGEKKLMKIMSMIYTGNYNNTIIRQRFSMYTLTPYTTHAVNRPSTHPDADSLRVNLIVMGHL